jgi:hypothetical protein
VSWVRLTGHHSAKQDRQLGGHRRCLPVRRSLALQVLRGDVQAQRLLLECKIVNLLKLQNDPSVR